MDINNVNIIRNIIAEVFEVAVDRVQGQANFVMDLGADSLRVIEILARLETALGVSINQSMLVRMDSLDAVVEVVEESMALAA